MTVEQKASFLVVACNYTREQIDTFIATKTLDIIYEYEEEIVMNEYAQAGMETNSNLEQ